MKHVTNGIEVKGREERIDATYAPDARKAREIVRSLKTNNLRELALEIAKVTSEQTIKHKLQELAETFRLTNEEYRRVEDRTTYIDWMGDRNGHLPPPPEWAPEHMVSIIKAWSALLIAVNATTKVGVHKLSRYSPIQLQVDLEDAPKLITGGVTWN